MNKEQMPFEQRNREIMIKEMYFHCDYEDAVVRTMPTTGAVRFFVRLHRGGVEYEVEQRSTIAMQVRESPVPIKKEDYWGF